MLTPSVSRLSNMEALSNNHHHPPGKQNLALELGRQILLKELLKSRIKINSLLCMVLNNATPLIRKLDFLSEF